MILFCFSARSFCGTGGSINALVPALAPMVVLPFSLSQLRIFVFGVPNVLGGGYASAELDYPAVYFGGRVDCMTERLLSATASDELPRGTEYVFSAEDADMLFKRRGKFLANIVIFLGVFATCEWQCVNVGMSMRWRGRSASMATFSVVPFFSSGDGAVLMPLSPSAICLVGFPSVLGGADCPVF